MILGLARGMSDSRSKVSTHGTSDRRSSTHRSHRTQKSVKTEDYGEEDHHRRHKSSHHCKKHRSHDCHKHSHEEEDHQCKKHRNRDNHSREEEEHQCKKHRNRDNHSHEEEEHECENGSNVEPTDFILDPVLADSLNIDRDSFRIIGIEVNDNEPINSSQVVRHFSLKLEADPVFIVGAHDENLITAIILPESIFVNGHTVFPADENTKCLGGGTMEEDPTTPEGAPDDNPAAVIASAPIALHPVPGTRIVKCSVHLTSFDGFPNVDAAGIWFMWFQF